METPVGLSVLASAGSRKKNQVRGKAIITIVAAKIRKVPRQFQSIIRAADRGEKANAPMGMPART
jgi:hypothetical protein